MMAQQAVAQSGARSNSGGTDAQQTRHARRVYVGNLPFGVTEQDVCNFCTGVFEQSDAFTQVRNILRLYRPFRVCCIVRRLFLRLPCFCFLVTLMLACSRRVSLFRVVGALCHFCLRQP